MCFCFECYYTMVHESKDKYNFYSFGSEDGYIYKSPVRVLTMMNIYLQTSLGSPVLVWACDNAGKQIGLEACPRCVFKQPRTPSGAAGKPNCSMPSLIVCYPMLMWLLFPCFSLKKVYNIGYVLINLDTET